MLGCMVQFGWEKALAGPGADLSWWERQALEGAAALDTEVSDRPTQPSVEGPMRRSLE